MTLEESLTPAALWSVKVGNPAWAVLQCPTPADISTPRDRRRRHRRVACGCELERGPYGQTRHVHVGVLKIWDMDWPEEQR